MVCIGKECKYNKCNVGEFCGLKYAQFFQKGDECGIQGRIDDLEDDKVEIESELNSLYEYKKVLEGRSN